MILIASYIIETLKAAAYPLPVTVRDFYSNDKIVTPLITVDENPSNEGVYLDNQPGVVQNIFSVEVYAKPATIDGKAMNQKQVALKLALIVDKTLNEACGFTMTGQAVPAPYSDPTICRIPMRYIAYIDTRKEIDNILRGI